jgi:hypothetical protein
MPTLSLYDQQRRRRPGATPGECARAVAVQVLEELGVTQPPVDVAMVASALDIGRIVEDQDLPASGCLLPTDDGFEIRVRATDAPRRKRFTIAHECAHTFFDGYTHAPQFRCNPSTAPRDTDDLESLCDIAASELLLPTNLFRAAAEQSDWSLDAVEHLAETFEASLLAAGYRLVKVAPHPAAMLVAEVARSPRQLRTADPCLRLVNVLTNGPWPYFRRHKSIPENHPIHRASEGELVSEHVLLTGLSASPLPCHIEARPYHYRRDGHLRTRVLAVLNSPRTP